MNVSPTIEIIESLGKSALQAKVQDKSIEVRRKRYATIACRYLSGHRTDPVSLTSLTLFIDATNEMSLPWPCSATLTGLDMNDCVTAAMTYLQETGASCQRAVSLGVLIMAKTGVSVGSWSENIVDSDIELARTLDPGLTPSCTWCLVM